MAERTGACPRTAEWDANAVLTTVADTFSGGELDQFISRLPPCYAALFGARPTSPDDTSPARDERPLQRFG